MSILQDIKSFFKQKDKVVEPTKDENSITFSLDGFGRPWVSISLANTNSKSCEDFANMLFSINGGDYEQTILDLIVSLSKEKPSLAPALETVLISWGMLLATLETAPKKEVTKNTGNRPFIRPRNVFLGADK